MRDQLHDLVILQRFLAGRERLRDGRADPLYPVVRGLYVEPTVVGDAGGHRDILLRLPRAECEAFAPTDLLPPLFLQPLPSAALALGILASARGCNLAAPSELLPAAEAGLVAALSASGDQSG